MFKLEVQHPLEGMIFEMEMHKILEFSNKYLGLKTKVKIDKIVLKNDFLKIKIQQVRNHEVTGEPVFSVKFKYDLEIVKEKQECVLTELYDTVVNITAKHLLEV